MHRSGVAGSVSRAGTSVALLVPVEASMLRITCLNQGPMTVRLRLEGSLTESELDALLATAKNCRDEQHAVVLDLAGMRFVNEAGAAVLLDLRSKGSVLVHESAFVRELLKEVSR